jgi:hypothetical protein
MAVESFFGFSFVVCATSLIALLAAFPDGLAQGALRIVFLRFFSQSRPPLSPRLSWTKVSESWLAPNQLSRVQKA